MRGHICKRGRKWNVVVDVGYVDGKRKLKWFSGYDRRADAKRALTEILHRLDNALYVAPSKQTLGEYLVNDWLPGASVELKPSTVQSYELYINSYIVPGIGGAPLQKLSADRLSGFYAGLLKNGKKDGKGGLSRRSVRYCHAIIHKALSDAVRRDRLPRNVASSAAVPKQEQPEMKTWTKAQLRVFLDSVKDDRLYAAWMVAAHTGMRRAELLGLKWDRVDLESRRVSITRTLLHLNGRLEFGSPKTEQGKRMVSIDVHTASVLADHRKAQVAEKLALGAGYQDNGLVFCSGEGEPIKPDSFSQFFVRKAKQLELPRIRLHDLRHGHATYALEEGIPAKVVADRLGHAKSSFTLDQYSHVSPGLREEAADVIAEAVMG